MKSENTNKKTTCNKKSIPEIKPEPAKVVAAMTGKSVSYVKKVRTGIRADHSESAALIKEIDETIIYCKKIMWDKIDEIIINRHNSYTAAKRKICLRYPG